MNSAAEDYYTAEVATFGDRLAAAREAAGMTQETLAKRMGIKLTTLRRWEDDFAEPRANKLSMISGLLGVSMPWLITGEGDGLAGPEADVADTDTLSILNEIREIRLNLTSKAEQVGRLEKRLRKLLQEDTLV